jgi:tetratricopeptide (TPR) repeat protein
MNKHLLLALALAGAVVLPAAVTASIGNVNKDSVSFYLKLGKEQFAARKYATAWLYYEKAANQDACNPDIQLAIAEVCLKMNRMAPAIRALDSACKLRPADYNSQWLLVQHYFYYDQAKKVIELLPELHKRLPEAKGWAYMLGKSYQSLQDYGKAIEYLEIAIKEDPANAEAMYQVGRMYILMENYKKSVPYYERSLALDSTTSPTRTYELALVLSTVERYDASLAYFTKALDRGYKPHDDFYMNMAYTLADAHKTQQAITMLQEMLVRRPVDLGLLNGLAEVCFTSGLYEEAIGYWKKVLVIDNNARTLYSIGTAYIKMGNSQEGQKLCERAISMDPSLAVLKHARQMSF